MDISKVLLRKSRTRGTLEQVTDKEESGYLDQNKGSSITVINVGGFHGREVGIPCSRVRRVLEQEGVSEGSREGRLNPKKRRQAVA